VEFLCALVVILAVVTVVGHGLWLLIAAVGHSLRDPATPVSRRARGQCRNCGATHSLQCEVCPVCRLTRTTAADLGDLAVTLRKLQEFQARRHLADDTFQQLSVLINRRRRELYDDVPVVRPVVEPVRPIRPFVAPPPVRPPKPVVAPSAPPVPVIVVPAPPPPPVPRRSLAEWLAAFMEDRNILWGELVGGLLVVGCSAALVLSLWQTLERIPLFPFLMFVGITAALFLVGHYTLRRWRLESTSRGLLVIATLLVPLNFLVLAGLSPRSTTPWEYGVKLAAIPLFAWLVFRAAAVLFPPMGAASRSWWQSDPRSLRWRCHGCSTPRTRRR
jgi:hypothetical protein